MRRTSAGHGPGRRIAAVIISASVSHIQHACRSPGGLSLPVSDCRIWTRRARFRRSIGDPSKRLMGGAAVKAPRHTIFPFLYGMHAKAPSCH